eukprot:scaffold265965_cov30-Tisochrysis_lutea.AAC.1
MIAISRIRRAMTAGQLNDDNATSQGGQNYTGPHREPPKGAARYMQIQCHADDAWSLRDTCACHSSPTAFQR